MIHTEISALIKYTILLVVLLCIRLISYSKYIKYPQDILIGCVFSLEIPASYEQKIL